MLEMENWYKCSNFQSCLRDDQQIGFHGAKESLPQYFVGLLCLCIAWGAGALRSLNILDLTFHYPGDFFFFLVLCLQRVIRCTFSDHIIFASSPG